MSFVPEIGSKNVTLSPGVQLDAFTRLRVSNPDTVFDSKQLYDTNEIAGKPLVWDDQEVSGGSTTSVFSASRASTTIGVAGQTAGRRVRQTKRWFNYQPGKSQLVLMTNVVGTTESGVTKRWGYFNDSNGLFFSHTEGGFAVNVRSNVTGSPVTNTVAQASWNIDPLDGTGPSGITIDETKSQIWFVDFEWLGVGRVRWGVFVDGAAVEVHETRNANVGAAVYMSTPNLPLRVEIEGDGDNTGSDSIEAICSSVISEGGQEITGSLRGVFRESGFLTGNNVFVYPIISMRLKSGAFGANIIIKELSSLVVSKSNYVLLLLLNPDVAGTDNASWVSLPGSAIEYDVSRNNANTLTNYYTLAAYTVSEAASSITALADSLIRLGSKIDGTKDEFVIAIKNVSAGLETYYGSVNFIELS